MQEIKSIVPMVRLQVWKHQSGHTLSITYPTDEPSGSFRIAGPQTPIYGATLVLSHDIPSAQLHDLAEAYATDVVEVQYLYPEDQIEKVTDD